MPKLNIHNPEAYVEESMRHYGLPRDTIIDELEQAMSESMSYVTNYSVEAWLDVMEDGLDIQLVGYITLPDLEMVTKVIDIDSLTKNTVKLISMRANQRLDICVARREAVSLRHVIGRVFEGEVVAHPDNDSFVRVELQLGTFGLMDTITCICPLTDQPPHERGTYRLGDVRMWFVKRVKTIWHGDAMTVQVIVSRATHTLPLVLIQEACIDKMKGADIAKLYCVERKVGYQTIIASATTVPKEIIKKVSKELDEEVVIWRQDKFRQDPTGRYNQRVRLGKTIRRDSGTMYASGARA